MSEIRECRNLSVSIRRRFDDAYEFLSVPENFAQWASGLAGSLHKFEGEWIADSPDGPVKVRFSEYNAFGVLDHWVYPQPQVEIYIPLRLIPNASGCELILSLFRLPEMTDEQFSADTEWVMRDLHAARKVLESNVT